VFIFGSLEESPIWARLERERAARGQSRVRSPVGTLFSREFGGVMLVNIMLTTGAGAGYYLTAGFLPTFLKVVVRLPDQTASLILIAGSLFAIVCGISMGHLSTTIGRRRSFIVMGVLRVVLLPFCFVAMVSAGADAMRIVGLVFLMTFLATGSYAPLLIFLNERFPTAVRSTGTGLSWNIGFAIGGIMPTFVSLASPTTDDLALALGIFLAAISLIFLAGALLAPETKGDLR
jgi:MFS transporter, MHS family, proline/betaine transporter